MVNYLLKDRIAYLTIENGKANAFGYEQIESMQAGLNKAIDARLNEFAAFLTDLKTEKRNELAECS